MFNGKLRVMRVLTSHQGFTRAFSIRVFITRSVVPTVIFLHSVLSKLDNSYPPASFSPINSPLPHLPKYLSFCCSFLFFHLQKRFSDLPPDLSRVEVGQVRSDFNGVKKCCYLTCLFPLSVWEERFGG